MQILHFAARRPSAYLAFVIAFACLLASMACSSAATPEPAPVPAENPPQGAPAATQQVAAIADPVVINLPIANRATTLTREDLQVKKGDTVSINLTADEAGEIHLHGYDLTAPVSPGSPGTLKFVAETAGAFGINFHVFASEGMDSDASGDGHDHSAAAPDQVESSAPVSVAITAEPDEAGGVDVQITTEGFRFAPELVDQDHTPGAGHAHIYLDGEKLSRVFESSYHIADVPPGEHEVRVSLNANNHSELLFDGEVVEATAMVNVPDVGQGHGDSDRDSGHDGDGHDHGEHEVVAEVHLGNLEVYP